MPARPGMAIVDGTVFQHACNMLPGPDIAPAQAPSPLFLASSSSTWPRTSSQVCCLRAHSCYAFMGPALAERVLVRSRTVACRTARRGSLPPATPGSQLPPVLSCRRSLRALAG
eukprot:756081-Rhodomonas_salina.2